MTQSTGRKMIDFGLIVSASAFALASALFMLLMIILFDDRRRNKINRQVQELLDYRGDREKDER